MINCFQILSNHLIKLKNNPYINNLSKQHTINFLKNLIFYCYNIFLLYRYQSWMKLFPSETYHLLLNNENDCLGSTAIHRIQYKLNMLDEIIFPLLKDSGIPCEFLKICLKYWV